MIFRKIINNLKKRFTKIDNYNSVIIMVDGRFCSVLLKYALGTGIKKHTGIDIKYDLTWFKKNGKDHDNKFDRKFQFLDVFPELDFKIATKREIKFYKKNFYYNNKFPYKFNQIIFRDNQPRYIDGYWENWKYLYEAKEELIEQINFKNLKLSKLNQDYLNDILKSENPVAIHVRRGDFVNLGLSILEAGYYLNAIRFIENKLNTSLLEIYFFSNDMEWVKKEIIPRLDNRINYILVEENNNNNGYIDLYLISQCKHQISSNSSFGFWGGFLNQNPNKIVIIPNKWVPVDDEITIDSETAHNYPGFHPISFDGK